MGRLLQWPTETGAWAKLCHPSIRRFWEAAGPVRSVGLGRSPGVTSPHVQGDAVTARMTGLGRGLEALIRGEDEFNSKKKSLQVIDRKGRLVGDDPGLDPELYQQMYRNMVLSRELDRRMLALQRQGRIGTYAMLEGQEAVQIGSALALEVDDFVFPSYREHGVQVTRGLPIEVLLAYWKGLPNARWDMEKYRTGMVAVAIASQLPHAVGYSYVTKLRGDDTVTAVYFGDGGTSESDFH